MRSGLQHRREPDRRYQQHHLQRLLHEHQHDAVQPARRALQQRHGTTLSGRYATADAINTSVSTASSAAATTLTVAGVTGYQAGQTLLVDTGTNQDTVTVSSVNTATNTLTLSAGMAHAHAVGVPVVLRAVSWLDTTTGSTTHTYRVSAVSVNLAESAFAPAAGVTA